jgi:hypothetical protein
MLSYATSSNKGNCKANYKGRRNREQLRSGFTAVGNVKHYMHVLELNGTCMNCAERSPRRNVLCYFTSLFVTFTVMYRNEPFKGLCIT